MSDSTHLASIEEATSRARAIVRATTFFDDPKILAETSAECTGAMKGLAIAAMDADSRLVAAGDRFDLL